VTIDASVTSFPTSFPTFVPTPAANQPTRTPTRTPTLAPTRRPTPFPTTLGQRRTYAYILEVTFNFLNALVEPATAGDGDVVDNAEEFYRLHYCKVYPDNCNNVETLNSRDVRYNISDVFSENYVKITYDLRVSFLGRNPPTEAEALLTVTEFDPEEYLANFVNNIDQDGSNFKL